MRPTSSQFRDHFSPAARDYARYRPGYPDALFSWIASEAPSRAVAWDAATGTGQAALGLAAHFDRVVATDASEAQLASAQRHARVYYVRAKSEACAIASSVAGAVCVAQALHWFDMPSFFAECARVAMPGAIVAVWTYGTLEIGPDIDGALTRFYEDVVGPYWPPERRIVEREYADIELPFAHVATPSFAMVRAMTLDDLAGYIGTWSATLRYRKATGTDPVPAFIASIAGAWGTGARETRWPIGVRAGRVA